MLSLFRNPLLRLLGRLWWLPVALIVLAAGALGGFQIWERATTGFAVVLSFIGGMIGAAWVHGAVRSAQAASRHGAGSHRFLCPRCLQFGPMRYACGGCGAEVEAFVVHTGGAYVNDCPQCHAPLFSRDGVQGKGVQAYCAHCRGRSDREIYHERAVRVVGAVAPARFAELFASAGAAGQGEGGFPYSCRDNGERLTYVLDLAGLPASDEPVQEDHALRSLEAVWVAGGDGEALALGQAADRFVRLSQMSETRRREVPVWVQATALEPAVRNLLQSRFGPVSCGVDAEEFAGPQRAPVAAPAAEEEPVLPPLSAAPEPPAAPPPDRLAE